MKEDFLSVLASSIVILGIVALNTAFWGAVLYVVFRIAACAFKAS